MELRHRELERAVPPPRVEQRAGMPSCVRGAPEGIPENYTPSIIPGEPTRSKNLSAKPFVASLCKRPKHVVLSPAHPSMPRIPLMPLASRCHPSHRRWGNVHDTDMGHVRLTVRADLRAYKADVSLYRNSYRRAGQVGIKSQVFAATSIAYFIDVPLS